MAGRKKARRAPNGAGSIYHRESDGRWVGAAYVLTGAGVVKRKVVYGSSWEEAHAKLVTLLDRNRRGIPAPEQPWTVAAYLEYWLTEVVQLSRRASTTDQYSIVIRKHLVPQLGRRRMERLSVADVQRFVAGQLNAGKSVPLVQVMIKVLSAALAHAQREELVFRNVARLAVLPKAPAVERHRWTLHQLRTFLTAARADPLYPVFVLLAYYGLRRGEALGLRWIDIDRDSRVIRIANQVQRAGGQLAQRPVKTAAGRRTLPLIDLLAAVLDDQHDRQARQRMAAGERWNESGLVVTTATGNPVEPRNLARTFARISASEGLPAIKLHELRRMCATLLKSIGVPPRDAMAILGHSRYSVTMEIYTDSGEDAHRDALDKLSGILNGAVATHVATEAPSADDR
jgi:integrase